MGVAEAVAALLQRLEHLGRDHALALVRPPYPQDAVVQALDAERMQATAALLEWFAVWDGQSATGTLGLMDVLPGFYALSLQDGLAHKNAHASWPRSWLPVLADGGGDFYVLDTQVPAAPVLRIRVDEAAPEVLAPSLAAFAEAAVRGFDAGVIFVQDGYLEQDEEEWRRLLGIDG